jgi:4'-phosphopantetheinyl transferase
MVLIIGMITLLPTDLHLWPIHLNQLDNKASEFANLLSEEEAARAAKFHFVRDRQSFTASRALLRILLGNYLGVRPETILFSYGQAGKPRLKTTSSICFNASHSGSMALFAFTQASEIGVDLEEVRALDNLCGIAEQFFCAEEYRELISLSPELRERAFFQCWTRKESYVKAVGEGFSTPLDRFRVTLLPQDPARLVHIGNDPAKAAGWTLHNVDVGPGFAAAVAYAGPAKNLQLITYSFDGPCD